MYTTCLASELLSNLNVWRNPNDGERNWLYQNNPNNTSRSWQLITKKVVVQVTVPFLITIAAMESIMHRFFAMLFYFPDPGLSQFAFSIAKSSDFTILWGLRIIVTNVTRKNLFTKEAFARREVASFLPIFKTYIYPSQAQLAINHFDARFNPACRQQSFRRIVSNFNDPNDIDPELNHIFRHLLPFLLDIGGIRRRPPPLSPQALQATVLKICELIDEALKEYSYQEQLNIKQDLIRFEGESIHWLSFLIIYDWVLGTNKETHECPTYITSTFWTEIQNLRRDVSFKEAVAFIENNDKKKFKLYRISHFSPTQFKKMEFTDPNSPSQNEYAFTDVNIKAVIQPIQTMSSRFHQGSSMFRQIGARLMELLDPQQESD